MPLPKPTENETQDEFLQRCMGDDVMNEEYTDTDQRYAVCLSIWEKPKYGGYQMERKTFKFEVKTINEEEGVIEGYGSTFDDIPDAYGDIVDPGAFTKTIKDDADNIVSLFNHNIEQPIGKPELNQDKKGLFARIHLVRGVQKAEETLLLAKAGVIKKMSIGYDTIKQKMENGIRHLQEVRLYDVSPVIFAANPNATITGVKTELEHLLKTGRVLSAANRDKVQAALNALQALLEAADDESSSDKSTSSRFVHLEPAQEQEAAYMEGKLDGIRADIDSSEVKEADARLDALIEKLNKGVKTNV